jgi:hypothetical protein
MENFRKYFEDVMRPVSGPDHPAFKTKERLDALMAGDMTETPQTYNDWLDAVSSSVKVGPFYDYIFYGKILKFVPDEFKRAELCMAAVSNEGSALEFVPESLKTAETCRVAVRCGHQLGMGSDWKGYGEALKFVPIVLRTKELCLDAVLNQGSFDDVPGSIKTKDFFVDVLSQWNFGYKKLDEAMMSSVPSAIKGNEFFLEVVKRNNNFFKYVPSEYTTEELCLVAVMQNGCALKYVPDALKTTQICLAALDENEDAKRYMPGTSKQVLVKKVEVIDINSEFVVFSDTETGRTKKLNISLVYDNDLCIDNGKVELNRSLYNAWFKDII